MPYYPETIIQDFMLQYQQGHIPQQTAHNFLMGVWDSNNEIQYGSNYRKIYDDPEKESMLRHLGLDNATTRGSGIAASLALYFKTP